MNFHFDNTYAKLPEAFSAKVDPTPVRAPEWIALNRPLLEELGVELGEGTEAEAALLEVLSGNAIAENSEPLSMAYAGHQFGGFVPQLGDGRAILLGEVVDGDGVRRDIQLKGSGPTPFSRRGDGRSALGPVLREYLLSEAMAALGVPTTRALAAVWTGESVVRDEVGPGGVFTRVASSHLRIGTFQWFAARQDEGNLRVLADYAIERHDPEVKEADHPYQAFLDRVIQRQAELVAHWMALGFIHGVMNTDNMSISGETIDFGPCAFLDHYDAEKVFSSIDRQGRYAYANQGPIAHWNLTRLAEALLPLFDEDEKTAVGIAEASLEAFPTHYRSAVERHFLAKLGWDEGQAEGGDSDLIGPLLSLMQEDQADFTRVFTALTRVAGGDDEEALLNEFKQREALVEWLERWRSAHGEAGLKRAGEVMRRANPVFIPRNHRVEEVIQAGNTGDFAPFRRLHEILQRPFEEQPEAREFEAAPTAQEVVRATFCGT